MYHDDPRCTMTYSNFHEEIDGSGGGDRSKEPAGGNYLHPKRDLGGYGRNRNGFSDRFGAKGPMDPNGCRVGPGRMVFKQPCLLGRLG
jgi:hypothetical protein